MDEPKKCACEVASERGKLLAEYYKRHPELWPERERKIRARFPEIDKLFQKQPNPS